MAEWECVPHAYPSNIAETLAALWNPTMRMCHPTGNRHNGMQLVLFIPEPICTFLQMDTSLDHPFCPWCLDFDQNPEWEISIFPPFLFLCECYYMWKFCLQGLGSNFYVRISENKFWQVTFTFVAYKPNWSPTVI